MPSHNGPGVISRPADMISPPLGCLMRLGADPCLRCIVAHLKHASRCLNLSPDAPSRHERARKRRIGEVDREGVIQHSACPGWRHDPPVRTAVLVEPSGDLGMPLAETAWRNSDPDANREVPFGQGDHLSWVAGHYVPLLFETRITLTFRCVQPLGAALLRAGRRAADGRGALVAMLGYPLDNIRIIGVCPKQLNEGEGEQG
jgi:hypothetical protein